MTSPQWIKLYPDIWFAFLNKTAEYTWQKTIHTLKAMAYTFHPKHISDTVPMCVFLLQECFKTRPDDALPDTSKALSKPDGLCGIARSIDTKTLRAAYKKALYPWCHTGPLKWWAPRQRSLLYFEDYKIDKSTLRKLRNNHFSFTFDQAFTEVIRACAQPRPGTIGLTWISEKIIHAYTKAHEAGDAHSIEVWDQNGKLVGGIYGYVSGQIFFTESQFYRTRDASKAGFAVLNRHLQHWGFVVNDAKNHTSHLASLGFKSHPNAVLYDAIARHGREAGNNDRVWQIKLDLCGGDWVPSAGIAPHKTDSQTEPVDKSKLKRGIAA